LEGGYAGNIQYVIIAFMIDEVSAVIPAYNEVGNIEDVVSSIVELFSVIFNRYELIIINDGSNDGTEKIIRKLSEQNTNIKVIDFKVNRGYGVALWEGFQKASLKYVFYTDSDGQFDIKDIKELLPLVEPADMVIGYRINRNDNLLRRLLSRGYNFLVFLFFGIKCRDVNSSFKIFKREIVDSINLISNGFSVDAELVWKTKEKGYKITETGVRHFKRNCDSSKVKSSDIINTIRELIRIKKRGA